MVAMTDKLRALEERVAHQEATITRLSTTLERAEEYISRVDLRVDRRRRDVEYLEGQNLEVVSHLSFSFLSSC